MAVEFTLANGVLALGGDRFAEAELLVRDGRIAAIGPEAERHRAGVVLDLAGGTLAPGFGDAHAHPLIGGLESLHAPIRGARSVAEVQARVATFAAAHPAAPVVYGEGFELTLAEGGRFHAAWLDDVVRDRPVVLRANDIHTVWCNSAALRRIGLTAGTPDPVDGWIDRGPDGAPLGTLREWGAFLPALALVPQPDLATKAAALIRAAHTLAAAGITWVQDAWVETADLPAYQRAAAAGLPVRMNLALRVDPARWREQRAELRAARVTVEHDDPSGALTARTVKLFVDGIVESGTASVLTPYDDRPGCCGLPNWPAEEFLQAVRALDADGFQVHVHAMGDAAVRLALDAIEGAARANGPRDRRPVLTHLQLIDPADLPRLARLGVIACFQPLWAQPDALMTELTLPRLGKERGDRQYPIASVLASGARVSFASDWPITGHEPLAGMAVALTRSGPSAADRAWTAHERIDLGAALDGYTLGSAHQAFEEDQWGALRVGMRADLVHLDTDLRTVSPEQLRDVRVVRTWLGGRPTHTTPSDHRVPLTKGTRA